MQGHKAKRWLGPCLESPGETERKADSSTLTHGVPYGQSPSLETQGQLFPEGPCGLRWDSSSRPDLLGAEF